MPGSEAAFAGSIPEPFDRYMVPSTFASYAADLARRAAAASPTFVPEISAGSGVVTGALAPRLPADARDAVTDLNQAMIDDAGSRHPSDAGSLLRPSSPPRHRRPLTWL